MFPLESAEVASTSSGHQEHEPPRYTDSPTHFTDPDDDSDEIEEEESNEEEVEEDTQHDHSNESEEESEGSTEEEDEDDEEPALKYERIGGSVPDLLKKDSASALIVSDKIMALGTHGGIIHILSLTGTRIKSYKPHMASVVDIVLDTTGDFVGTASIDGQVVIHSLSTPESYAFDMKRPMRTVALEPNFAKRGTRAVVSGGLAGSLIMREKGWLGHKETVLHSGEGPIWQVRWRGRLVAWANDVGVKIYDTTSQARITFIDRPESSPRADLFKCTLHWQDDSTLLIGWADHIKVARVRARPRNPATATSATANLPPLLVEITAVFQLDCMIAGIVPHPTPNPPPNPDLGIVALRGEKEKTKPQQLTSFLVVAYTPPDTYSDEQTEDRARQARKAADRPELRIVSRAGEELAADALSITDYQKWGCNDYVLASVTGDADEGKVEGRSYVVMSPRDLVLVKPRDRRDHVAWLLERRRYEEALDEVEMIESDGDKIEGSEGQGLSVQDIGQRYIEHLVGEGDFIKAAQLCPKVCANDSKRWEDWIFAFADKKQLQAIIPYVPTDSPRLDHVVYEMMLAHFLTHDRQTLLQTIKEWPREIYDIAAVIVAVRATLDKVLAKSSTISATASSLNNSIVLMECLAELYTINRQPGKALPFFLRLRRPNVLDLIRDNNLFTDVQDQVLLLVEFDHEMMEKHGTTGSKSEAITLLVDNIHSIPISRVVQQLQARPYYLFLYLDAVVGKDPHLVSDFADLQVKLYAEFATPRLIDFLRASNYYNLEMAYEVCKERDLVPEMVFLLGHMGNNKQALTLIIERLGDVRRAIDFAKERRDDDLWEDLLKYSETRPAFIRGLLENVGVEISPIRLIRRIKNGLEIPGLKEALIKILQDFHLQISLLEGCQTILNGDSADLSRTLQKNQSSGFFLTAKTKCPICTRTLQENPQGLVLLFLCRHVVHATCANGGDHLPIQSDPVLRGMGGSPGRGISGSIAFESMIRPRLSQGCPVCYKNGDGLRT
ncbi:vacuolar assembling protein VPS41 [Crucibulum laeve]|uniref:Vacuolar protein sorting-associated protein 41 n=1 Tax=Crucibulum laeve TaxID=68775 RepID=A0A5C3MGF9_9AGAR|nr:vacuolar assembling protein VPS41 [Crucibulum laeve]